MWDDPKDLEEFPDYDMGKERVLVALVPSLRDWDLVCHQHWYRIPLSRAPQRIGADYLAFYHPKVFEKLRWTITYYAPIERYQIVRRRELLPKEPDHPRADALYFKIMLGPLETLPHPIPSNNLRRVTFIMTTMTRLLQATEINDLWVTSTRRDHLQRALQVSEAGQAALPWPSD
jgi:hypothetical protein